MKVYIIMFFSFLSITAPGYAQQIIKGLVVSDNTNDPLPAAVIKINGKAKALTNHLGEFNLELIPGQHIATINYIGYLKKEFKIEIPFHGDLIITLTSDVTELKEVTVNTGYQEVSAERLTGSVFKLSNDLLQRRVSTNILNRLEDMAPGLVFNRSGVSPYKSPVSIRGQSTLFGNTDPLIVLNSFPYDGDISTINPNDVESITILKDAAAASIWGARAGNGVIVITTKNGGMNKAPVFNFSSKVTATEKPDPFYMKQMKSPEYIETEKVLFAENYYRATELSAGKLPLTPVVELLIAKRDGLIDPGLADSKIEDMKQLDIREQYSKYLYRTSLYLQQSMNVSGGGANSKYYLSSGWDRNLENLKENSFNRITVNADNSYFFLKDKLVLNGRLSYNQNKNTVNNPGTAEIALSSLGGIYPYAQIGNSNGDALPIANNYRLTYMQSAKQRGLLNWEYKPLDEIRLSDNTIQYKEIRADIGVDYKIIDGLKASILYQYINGNTLSKDNHPVESYFSRNQINLFSSVNADGSVNTPIPNGGILDQSNAILNIQQFRSQLAYSKSLGARNYISFMTGFEFKDAVTNSHAFRTYGYDDLNGKGQLVDYLKYYTSQVNPFITTMRIPYIDNSSSFTDRFVSYYGNGAYTFDDQYNVYISARLDKSNIFGVNTNHKGVPLWSAGLSWDLARSSFMKSAKVGQLKLRLSYGYNGNVDKTLSAYTTAIYYAASASYTGLPFAAIQNPPNPELRWERTAILNGGIDFNILKNRLSGSVDLYTKKGKDLLGVTPYAPSTGITSFKGNYADTKGNGVDINLQSINIQKVFNWQTNILFSYSKDLVTNYQKQANNSNYLEQGINGSFPLEGRPLYALYSYRWAGLDENGDPRGYVNNEISKDYTQIANTTAISDLIYHGSSRPLIYGAVRNTFTYKSISMSANISYRLQYYFRKSSISYAGNKGLGGDGDYYQRWQKPGDQNNTFIPSIPTINDPGRDNFYKYSQPLITQGDHIRFQDINLSYDFGKRLSNYGIQGLKLFLYADNIGILWKKTGFDIDPDFPIVKPMKSFSFGININL